MKATKLENFKQIYQLRHLPQENDMVEKTCKQIEEMIWVQWLRGAKEAVASKHKTMFKNNIATCWDYQAECKDGAVCLREDDVLLNA